MLCIGQLKKKKAIIRRYFEMTSDNFETIIDEILDADFINHDYPTSIPNIPKGREGLKQAMKNMLYCASSDLHYTINNRIAEGDKFVVSYTYGGKHTGEFMGIAPSGKN